MLVGHKLVPLEAEDMVVERGWQSFHLIKNYIKLRSVIT